MTTFLATAGADAFFGGAGDEVSYVNAPAFYDSRGFRTHQIIDYAGQLGGSTGWAVGDTVSGVNHFRLSNYGDLFVSQLSSTAAIWVVGGTGNDSFFAGNGISHFDGGGTENSILDPVGNMISYAYTGAVILSLDSSIASSGAATGDTWTNVQSLEGSAYNDTLYSVDDGLGHLLIGDPSEGYAGSTGNDVLVGAITAVNGAQAADTFIPEGGADTIVLGARTNWIDYENAPTGLTVDLLNTSANTGDAAGDVYKIANGSHSSSAWQTLTSAHTTVVVNLTGSDFNDNLSGTAGDNHILGDPLEGLANYNANGADTVHGQGGNDWIEGIGGEDSLYGDAGNDLLVGGLGADALWGGTGADTFLYKTLQDSAASGYDILHDFESGTDHLDISAISSISSISLLSSGGGTFLFSNTVDGAYLEIGSTAPIQASDLVVGAGVTSINMVGDANFNILIGGGLNDTIQGGGGGDWLAGGGGADRFIFTVTSDSTVATPDSIFDFQTGVDKIDLTALHIGSASVNWLSSGGSTYVFIDANLDATNDMLLQLNGAGSVQAGDFLY